MPFRNVYILIPAFLLSCLLWLSLSLDQTYEIEKRIRIKVNVTKPFAISSYLPVHVDAKLKSKGWLLLKYLASFDKEIVYEFNPLLERKQKLSVIDFLNDNLEPGSIIVSGCMPETLSLKIGRYEEKYIKILPRFSIECKEGYQVVGKPNVEPDSVLVGGAAEFLDGLAFIPTEIVNYTNVNADINKLIRLSDSLQNIITLKQDEARLYIKVEPSAEKVFQMVEINVNNVPHEREVLLLPQFVELQLKGGVNQLASLDINKIEGSLEFLNILKDTTGSVSPQFTLPSGISIISVNPPKIQYVIKKRLPL